MRTLPIVAWGLVGSGCSNTVAATAANSFKRFSKQSKFTKMKFLNFLKTIWWNSFISQTIENVPWQYWPIWQKFTWNTTLFAFWSPKAIKVQLHRPLILLIALLVLKSFIAFEQHPIPSQQQTCYITLLSWVSFTWHPGFALLQSPILILSNNLILWTRWGRMWFLDQVSLKSDQN